MEQRTAYADDLLKHEKFTFDSDERITINRKSCLIRPILMRRKSCGGSDCGSSTCRNYSENRRPEEEPCAATQSQPPLAETNAPAKTDSVTTPKKTDAEEIVDTLSHRYYRNLRFFTEWNNDDVFQVYLTALAHVYDPHSDYLGRAQMEEFAIGMNLSLFGIGAELRSGRLLQDSPVAAADRRPRARSSTKTTASWRWRREINPRWTSWT